MRLVRIGLVKVAFVTVGDPQRLTGGYLYHARIFPELRARGYEIVEIIASPAARAAQVASASAFAATFQPETYDVVVVDALARAVCAPSLDSWRERRPLVAMVHELPSVAGNAAEERPAEEPLLRAHRLIAVSTHGRDILIARGVPRERIQIVSPGRDRIRAILTPGSSSAASSITREGDQHSTSTGLPVRALCVAQWIPRKGISTLVQAWGMRARPGALLELVGEYDADPEYAAQVQQAIAQAHPDAPIGIRGAISDADLDQAYRAAAFFVLPTRYEGYGMAFAEALSYGLPVIACQVGPLPELVGQAALFVAPDSPTLLDQALTQMLAQPALRSRLALAARAQAVRLPTWEDTATGFQRVLDAARLSR